jgi:hypothetical protein
MARYPTSLSECSSDTTTLLEDDAPLFPPRRRDSLTAWSEDDNDDDDDVPAPQPLFPFHLIAGCSTAERAMCQISRTITSQELQGRGRIVGLKGTLTWTVVERCGPQPPPILGVPPASVCGRWTLCAVIALLPQTPRDMQEQLDATCVKPG